MSLDIANIGVSHATVVNGVDAHITLGDAWGAVWIMANVDVHVTTNGVAATVNDLFVKAFERVAVAVDSKSVAGTLGDGEVHFIKATGAADGIIWTTEVA